jgi:hypothetical protein
MQKCSVVIDEPCNRVRMENNYAINESDAEGNDFMTSSMNSRRIKRYAMLNYLVRVITKVPTSLTL